MMLVLCPSLCSCPQVVIPVVSVQLIKKHKTARLLPNGLAITTTASRKVTPAPSRCPGPSWMWGMKRFPSLFRK